MYEIAKMQMYFQSNYLICLLNFFYTYWKNLQDWNLFLLIWTKHEENNNGQSLVLLYVTKDDVK
jgi:hypothetical protein